MRSTLAHTVTSEQMAVYRANARRRWAEEQRTLAERQPRALQVALTAADYLRQEFSAQKILLFGSLAHQHWFSPTSDIDLAAWGIAPEEYFVAVARLQDLSPDFKIDLVAMENCRPDLRALIAEEGKPL